MEIGKGYVMRVGGRLSSLEVQRRINAGSKVAEVDWDYTIIPGTATAMKEKYGIEFGDSILPEDLDLADRLFDAGVEMLQAVGIYCMDTGTVMKVTEDEIWDAIECSPKSITVGRGVDAVTVSARHGNARKRPVVNGGPTAATVSEKNYSKMMESYAQESIIDTLYCGVSNTYKGVTVQPGGPSEMYNIMSEMKAIEVAKANVGRPGMAVFGPESAISTTSRISVNLPNMGMSPTDGHDIPLMNEMKINRTGMMMQAACEISGSVIMTEALPIFGGYAGGPEETAICDVAVSIAAFVACGAHIHVDGPIHLKHGTSTTRGTLQVLAHVGTAIDRNTDLLLGSMYYVGAGPCTEMCFLENAAQAICDAASGREFSAMSASAKGSALDKTTGMEARFAGKTLQAASGLRVEDANYLLDSIVGLYEGNPTIPEGYRFQDCYDLNTLEPTNFHQEIYSLTADKLRSLGLDIRD